MDAEGYQLSPASRFSFSLAAFLFQYQNSAGNKDNIKIELNYSLRTHLFKSVSLPVLADVFDDDFLDLEMMKLKAKEYMAGLMRVTDREMQIGRTFYGETYFDR